MKLTSLSDISARQMGVESAIDVSPLKLNVVGVNHRNADGAQNYVQSVCAHMIRFQSRLRVYNIYGYINLYRICFFFLVCVIVHIQAIQVIIIINDALFKV